MIVDGTKVGFAHQLLHRWRHANGIAHRIRPRALPEGQHDATWLIVSPAYRKRAIPIAWTLVKHIKGHSTPEAQLALLAYVRSLLPRGIAILLVGDCEFGVVEVLQKLDEWNWDYILRQKGRTHVCLSG